LDTLSAALAQARETVDAIDARVLAQHVLGRDAAYLIAHGERELSREEVQRLQQLVAQRAAGMPVAYLVGEREFYGRPFRCTPAVLIPRPETELLVELALLSAAGRPSRVLDLGTGSGCIAITLGAECAGSRVVGTDVSAAALAIAAENARLNRVTNVEFRTSDWYAALGASHYDLIVSNPPYIAGADPHLLQGDLRQEPRTALVGGTDGLVHIRAVVAGAGRHLVADGWLWLEHGYDQGAACRALLCAAGFVAVDTHRDLAGLARVSGGQWPERHD